MSHASLESSTRVLEPEGHCLVTVRTEQGDERGCELVRYAHRYPVVLRVHIEKIEGFAPYCRNDYLAMLGKGNGSLGHALLRIV
jgi:hypothetical protein